MPEGDTIHKVAAFLAPRMVDATVQSLTLGRIDASAASGRKIIDVVANGKHLYIALDNHWLLRSHLGMHGSWHTYPRADGWEKPVHRASLVLQAAETYFVCFNAKEVELVREPTVRARILGARIGPDLATRTVRIAELPKRARDIAPADTLLMDVLLDQRIAAGIGNVYKCELLFLGGWAPTTTLATLSDVELIAIYERAADLLGRNLHGGKRVTRFANDGRGRLWVYGRANKRCLSCGDTRVRYQRLGRHHRATYWCSVCQPEVAS